MVLLLLLGSLLAALAPLSVLSVSSSEKTFNDLKNQVPSAKGQWAVSMALGDSTQPGNWSTLYAGNATVPLGTCSMPTYDACSVPFMPAQILGTSLLRVTYNLKPTVTSLAMGTWTSQRPFAMEFKLCYSDAAFNSRPWRKKNKPYPRLTQNCLFNVHTVGWPSSVANASALTAADHAALSGTIIYDFGDSTMPSATLFLMMWLRCDDNTVCAFESTESPFYSDAPNGVLVYPPNYNTDLPPGYQTPGPYNGTYIQVQGYNPITPGMTAAAIVLSIFGPVFFVCYYIADQKYYSKTGKALSW